MQSNVEADVPRGNPRTRDGVARRVTDSGEPSSGASGADVGVRIVREVAAELGRSPMELEPLAGLVDIDALSSLTATRSVDVSFEYEGLRVSVRRDGSVEVEPAGDERLRR